MTVLWLILGLLAIDLIRAGILHLASEAFE